MAELSKFGEVAGYVEVGDRKLVMDDRSYLAHPWTKDDVTAMVWKQADVYILTIFTLQRNLAQTTTFLSSI